MIEAGAAVDPGVRRVSVVGASGSGKTRLSRRLSRILDLPLHELDRIRFDPAGAISGTFEQRASRICASDSWLIDGHYRALRDRIWDRAQLVVWLNYPLPLVIFRQVRRFAGKRREGGGGPGTGAGLPAASWSQRIGRLARTARERGEMRRLLDSRRADGLIVVELRSPACSERWLESLDRAAGKPGAGIGHDPLRGRAADARGDAI